MYTRIPASLIQHEIKRYTDDIPDEVFRQQLKSWLSISKYQESGSIYTYHKGIVLRRHQALSLRPDLISDLFGNQLPVLVDLELPKYEDYDILEEEFEKYELENRTPVYWICGIDKFLLGKTDTLFHYLRKRQADNPSISYVLFFSVNFLHPAVSGILTYTSTFLQNTCISALYTRETGSYFLDALAYKWNFTISDRLKESILANTSRHFTPLKQAARYIRDTGSTSTHDILNHDMMNIKLKGIIDGLLPSEQSALKKIVAGANDFNDDEAVSIDFLKKTGWLESVHHTLGITVPIFSDFIARSLTKNKQLECSSGKILLGGVPVTSLFSQQEQSVIRLFIGSNLRIVTRDEVAQALWANGWSEKYSDWAIDQIMSRIRKKLAYLELPKSLIESVKGKGFRYVGN